MDHKVLVSVWISGGNALPGKTSPNQHLISTFAASTPRNFPILWLWIHKTQFISPEHWVPKLCQISSINNQPEQIKPNYSKIQQITNICVDENKSHEYYVGYTIHEGCHVGTAISQSMTT